MIFITFIRSLIFNVLFYSTLCCMLLIILLIAPFVSYKISAFILNSWFLPFLRGMLYVICSLEIEVRGKENILQGKGVLYASKHQSQMETFFISSYVKGAATYIFKKELNYIPIFGWVVYFYGSIPVDRSGGGSAMKKMLLKAKEFIKNKRSIIIFPEGTRTKLGKSAEYKPGIAFLYQNLETKVVPVALNTAFFWGKGSFMRYPGKVIIEFMKPIEKGLDKKEFMDKLKDVIETKCTEINEETVMNNPRAKKLLEDSISNE